MKIKRFFTLALLVTLLSLLTATPSLALKLEEGMTWSYGIKLNGQLFCLNKITVTGREESEAETVWTFKDEYFYKVIIEDIIQVYRGELILRLNDDYTLISVENTINLNGEKLTHTLINETEDGYFFTEKVEGELQTNRIKTNEPLYLYDPVHPWLFELLLKEQVLSREKACRALSLSGKVIPIEYLGIPWQTQEETEGHQYLANKDRVYVNPELKVTRIDTEIDGVHEYVIGADFTEEQISGYDTKDLIEKLPSNIPLLQPRLVTSMTLSINLRAAFIDLAYLQTPTTRQWFRGLVDEHRVEGQVTIRAGETMPAAKKPFAFPVVIECASEFTEDLKDHPLLQIHHPELIATAQAITKEATDTWEAAVAIARWVWDNLTYDLSFKGKGLNAVEVLKARKGVCGHFSLLTVALCRALKIPARYITGYAYNRQENCFGLHAWVEVFADETGWRTMDPTGGQFDLVDATHIGFCDKITLANPLTGLKPGTIKILCFTPEEAGPIASSPLKVSQFQAKGKKWRYEVLSHGQKRGEYTAKLSTTADGNHRLTEEFTLPHSNTEFQSEFLLDNQGYVLSYYNKGLWNGVQAEREFLFGEDLQIKVVLDAEETQIKTYRMLKDEIAVDTFSFIQWGLLAARLVGQVEAATTKTVTVFLADSAEYKNLTAVIRPGPEEDRPGENGWLCQISGAQFQMELYLNTDRELIRIDVPEADISAFLVE